MRPTTTPTGATTAPTFTATVRGIDSGHGVVVENISMEKQSLAANISAGTNDSSRDQVRSSSQQRYHTAVPTATPSYRAMIPTHPPKEKQRTISYSTHFPTVPGNAPGHVLLVGFPVDMHSILVTELEQFKDQVRTAVIARSALVSEDIREVQILTGSVIARVKVAATVSETVVEGVYASLKVRPMA